MEKTPLREAVFSVRKFLLLCDPARPVNVHDEGVSVVELEL